jgi:hypothetical protein
MKTIFFCLLIIAMAGISWVGGMHTSASKLVEIRTGQWPIILETTIERSDTSYSLQFRDVQVLNSVVMDTLPFANSTQLKYFEKALTTLKAGHNGDIAKFKDYSIVRADKKYEGTWYLLKIKWGMTDFKQSEADMLIKTIRGTKFNK